MKCNCGIRSVLILVMGSLLAWVGSSQLEGALLP